MTKTLWSVVFTFNLLKWISRITMYKNLSLEVQVNPKQTTWVAALWGPTAYMLKHSALSSHKCFQRTQRFILVLKIVLPLHSQILFWSALRTIKTTFFLAHITSTRTILAQKCFRIQSHEVCELHHYLPLWRGRLKKIVVMCFESCSIKIFSCKEYIFLCNVCYTWC